MNENATQNFKLDELCSLTNTPKRTVRFYIQSGLMSRPVGEKRAAYYTQEHLEQLLFINKWQKSGLSLERIGELLRQQKEPKDWLQPKKAGQVEVWSHLTIATGVELQIEPSQAGLSPEQVRTLFKRVLSLYVQIKDEEGEQDE